ncbi:MBL fold metallo-hydrolase [Cellulomonas composti]|uniref:MBL fold metallo-hydrolase n=1 Tax=Cellulomonas composti TaxID=266130 RepID=A0A511J6D0_9CELL|nr:MBL fold metallo-hydrolase [Cellulomonas composti]GEL93547.1 MBL fold metallo-hydrolase [Cellulomonas composti]
MTTMTWWGHSCVRLDGPGGALVIDPGAFSDSASALAGAEAILVTHEHVDHVDVEPVAAAVTGGARLWSTAAVVELVAAAGAPADRLTVVASGDTIDVAGFTVRVMGERHAVVHADVPGIANVGYLVGGMLHPGDGFAAVSADVDLLLVPVSGPWLRLGEAIDWARSVAPRRVMPIHDGLLNERGQALSRRLLALAGGELVTPAVGERVALPGTHDPHDDVPELEYDETVPPRPEEEIADVARSVPDPQGHGGAPSSD